MPTLRPGLHYNPGHYLLIYGKAQTPASLALKIRGAAGTVNDVPNILGIQMRFNWRALQDTAFGPVDVEPILKQLRVCKANNMRLRVLLMIKGLLDGKVAPDYLRTPAYEGGVYNWPVGTTKNEHPKLWLTPVRDVLVDFCEKLAKALDSFGRPAEDERHWLEDIAFNETSWGNGWWSPWGWSTALQRENQQKMGQAMKACHAVMVPNLKGHFLTHFINFPNNSNFSILSDPVGGLCASMLTRPVAMGGPDSWMDDADAERGHYTYYPNFDGVCPVNVSVQNANYQHYNHNDQSGKVFRTDITIDQLYKHATTEGVMFRDKFRIGLRATHVVWAAMDTKIPGTEKVPFDLLRQYLRAKYFTVGNPDYMNKTPGVITEIPAMLAASSGGGTDPVVPPGPVVPSLAVDSGIVNNDGLTNNATINLAGMVAGAVKQWSRSETGPWTTGEYVPIQGEQTAFFRQRKDGLPGPISEGFKFTFNNVPPQLIRASGNGQYIYLTYARGGLNLSNVWRADKAMFKLKKNGGADIPFQGIFVSETLKYIRLELSAANALLAGQALTLTYAPTGTDNTLKCQDIAGNLVPAFTNLVVNNTTGMPAPTKTCTITQVNNNTVSGGYSNDPTVTIKGTVSAPLEAWEEIEVRRNAGLVGFTEPVTGGTTFEINDPVLQETGLRNYSARVINGQLLGTLSPQFAITFDTKEPSFPGVNSTSIMANEVAILNGVWGNGTNEELQVWVNTKKHTLTSTPPVVLDPVNPKLWTLNLGVLAVGSYGLRVRVEDLAGNYAETDGTDTLEVLPLPSINALRLAVCERRFIPGYSVEEPEEEGGGA